MRTAQKIKKYFIDEIPFLVGIPALVWQIIFFLVPLLFILYMSFVAPGDAHRKAALTLQNYTHFMQPIYGMVIFRSFIFALINAVLCTVFAYPVAYFLARVVQRLKFLWLFLLLLPFWTNFLLHVYAWFFILERGGVLNTILLKVGLIREPLVLLNSLPAVMLVMLYCYLPFMVLPLYSILEKLDPNLIEASADLGASSLQTFAYVTVPLTLPGLQLGFFLVFVPSFGEFAIPALVGGNKIAFVGSLISFLFLEAGNQPLACAYTIISIACIVVVTGAFYRFSRRIVYGK